MAALAYTPERILELKGFWSVVSWISRRRASSRQCVMISAKMLAAANNPGNRLAMRFIDNGALIYVEDDLGIATGIVEDLIDDGVSGRQIPKEYKKRLAQLQEGLDSRIDEDSAWVTKNADSTEEFLKQLFADAK